MLSEITTPPRNVGQLHPLFHPLYRVTEGESMFRARRSQLHCPIGLSWRIAFRHALLDQANRAGHRPPD